MKKSYLGFVLFFCISIIYSQNKEKDYTEAFKLVEVWLDVQKDFDKLLGISAVVVENQEVIWSGLLVYPIKKKY